MFKIFKGKKVININKIEKFCEWFIVNNKEIIDSVENSKTNNAKMMQYLDMVEMELAKAYEDFYKGEIHFGYGYNKFVDKWELNLCHFNKKLLKEATKMIADKLSKNLNDSWVFNIEK